MIFSIFLCLILVTVIVLIGYNNFQNHKETIIRQQQEHLLTIAKSISRSFDVFLNYKMNNLSMLSKDEVVLKAFKMNNEGGLYNQHEDVLKSFFEKYREEMDGVALLNKEGTLIYGYPSVDAIQEASIEMSTINNVLNSKQVHISKEYLSKPNQFSIDIIQPVIEKDEVIGLIMNTINLNKIYKVLIDLVQPGEKGYSMVKNREGFIVMHPVINQVGIESIKVRKEKFPQLDWSELEELNRRQVEYGEGYFVYNSKWWQDDEGSLTKKINSYTTFKQGDIAWIISVQMDYKEVEKPIKGALINILLISLLIIFIIVGGFYIFFKVDKKRRELQIETKYLKELNKTWEELIKSESRLRHSQKLQTIGVLTSGIAHEFNNLLSPILGYSEILLGQIEEHHPIYEDLLEINKSSLAAKEIAKQILRFSKEDGSSPEFTYLESSSVIRESIHLIRSILPKRIQIVECINSSQILYGNSVQIQQVLINLYTNAYHAMREKGGTLEIASEDVCISKEDGEKLNLHEGNYIKIQVKDHGVGMDEKTLEKIFEHFFTTKGNEEGTGLGLAVVKSIVQNHKGQIVVKSQVGIGTVVEVYFKAVDKNYMEILKEF
ncbi:sensor histidine kinase [Alkaliphilus oremlandii]|uniref:histidine kinase n=1 Tax=Alkaliphilus oremlandii (strain OhILAs) TaxID=350688 RepID=A8MLN4_ALKOO|nr:sensor histidine kinase [Alkaliphilus oremlandii]ABW17951.1 integral membrane sensor signal transduction histidine kinase [Alkaliphilus oremlandii OhILAs]